MSFASGVDMGEEICDSDKVSLPSSGPVHEQIISDRELGDAIYIRILSKLFLTESSRPFPMKTSFPCSGNPTSSPIKGSNS